MAHVLVIVGNKAAHPKVRGGTLKLGELPILLGLQDIRIYLQIYNFVVPLLYLESR